MSETSAKVGRNGHQKLKEDAVLKTKKRPEKRRQTSADHNLLTPRPKNQGLPRTDFEINIILAETRATHRQLGIGSVSKTKTKQKSKTKQNKNKQTKN